MRCGAAASVPSAIMTAAAVKRAINGSGTEIIASWSKSRPDLWNVSIRAKRKRNCGANLCVSVGNFQSFLFKRGQNGQSVFHPRSKIHPTTVCLWGSKSQRAFIQQFIRAKYHQSENRNRSYWKVKVIYYQPISHLQRSAMQKLVFLGHGFDTGPSWSSWWSDWSVAAIIGKKYQQLITSCLLVRHKVKSLSNRPVEERLVLFLNRGKIIILQQKKSKRN